MKNPIAVGALLTLLLTGCSSTDQATQRISAFDSATSTTTDGMKSAFTTVGNTYYQKTLSKAEIDYDTNKGIKPGDLNAFFKPEAITLRLDILTAVKKYADSLSTIMGTGQLDQYDTATKNLYSNLSTLDSDTVKYHLLTQGAVSSNDIKIFTTAVNALGRWYIDWKREKGVKQAIADMSPNVTKICNIFAKEIGTNPALHNGEQKGTSLRYEVWKDYGDIAEYQNQFILHNTLDAETKRAEIEKLADIFKQQAAADQTLLQSAKTLQALAKANDNLKTAFDSKSPTLDQAITDLQSEASRIKDFYQGLK